MKLKLIDTKKLNYNQIGIVVREHYEIGDYKIIADTYNSGFMSINITRKNGNKYLPLIYVEHDLEECTLCKFSIQTTSYGSLAINEIEEVIKGFEQAVEVVKILTEKFVNK